MAKIENYILVLPFISIIILFIGFITPTAFSQIIFLDTILKTSMFWIWGFSYEYNFPGPASIELLEERPFLFYPGFIATFISIVALAVIIGKANLVRKGKRRIKDVQITWFSMGLLLFVAAIIYIFGMEFGFRAFSKAQTGVEIGFWSFYSSKGFYSLRFGIIAPFISGALVITGLFVGKLIVKRKGEQALLENQRPTRGYGNILMLVLLLIFFITINLYLFFFPQYGI